MTAESEVNDTTGSPSNGYNVIWYDRQDTDEILEPGEIAKFLVQLPSGSPVDANQKIVIVFFFIFLF